MQIINKNQQKAYEDGVILIESYKPLSIEVTKNTDTAPLVISDLVVMPGDYYNEEYHLIIAAADIGSSGSWKEV